MAVGISVPTAFFLTITEFRGYIDTPEGGGFNGCK